MCLVNFLHAFEQIALLGGDHRIRLQILQAAGEEFSRLLALAAVAVEVGGAVLHGVYTHTHSYLEGEGIAGLLNEFQVGCVHLELLLMLCTCRVGGNGNS